MAMFDFEGKNWLDSLGQQTWKR